MRVIRKSNYEEASMACAELIASQIRLKPDCKIGLATGSTPVGTYKDLVDMYKAGSLDFSKVTSANLDEYRGLGGDHDQSYRYFMNTNLFDHVNIDKANTSVPDGMAQDVEAHCKEYEAKIDALGGIDVQILGIGRNGHIGFNEPDCELVKGTHLTELTKSTIEANSRFFASEDEVPKHALTMGLESVFKARKILLLVSGANKAEAVRAMVKGNISTKCPASLLCLHPDVVLICDEAAYSLV